MTLDAFNYTKRTFRCSSGEQEILLMVTRNTEVLSLLLATLQ